MSELPKGWTTARLDELLALEPAAITDGPFGSNLKTEHYQESGPRVIRLQNIGDGVFRDERAHIGVERFELLRKHEAQAGDILIAALGETLPRACMVPPGLGPAIVKADCIRVRVHPDIAPRFVCAMLNSPSVRRAATAQISGVGRPRLNLAKIRTISLRVPPSKEQDRIVAVIEEQFSRLDAAEASLRRVQLNVERMRRAVLSEAVSGDWPVKRLGDIADTTSGGTPSRRTNENFGGGIPWVKSGELRDRRVASTEETISEAGLRSSNAKLFPVGTLMIALYGATIGTLGLLEIEATTNQAVCAIFPHDPEVTPFLWFVLRAKRDELIRAGQGGAQPNISQGILRELEIPVISPKDQSAIVERAERSLSLLDSLSTAIDHSLTRSARLRRSILEQAFTGKLVPQDPDDEPASVLLERIQAERAVVSPAPRRTRKRALSTKESA